MGVVMGMACCFFGSGAGGRSDPMRRRRREILSDFGRGGVGADFLIPKTISRLDTLLGRDTCNNHNKMLRIEDNFPTLYIVNACESSEGTNDPKYTGNYPS